MNRYEVTGAFGDMPLLFPLLAGLVIICGLNPIPVFIIIGIAYLLCSSYYKLPVPIQPFKAFATIAIIQRLSPPVIYAGGLLMGIILLLVSFSSVPKYLPRIIPKTLVTGVHLGLSVLLLKSGAELIFTRNFSVHNYLFPNPDLFLLIICSLILLFFSNSRKVPVLLPIIFLGFFSRLVFGAPISMSPAAEIPNTGNFIYLPTLNDFRTAFPLLVIPQIFLTMTNAVVATNDAAHFYFGERAKRVNCRSLCLSMGLMNAIGCLFGGMPSCHGSTGLTAHYRFGAKTGNATIITGLFFLFSVFLLKERTVLVFSLFPLSILGLLLLYIGFQHAFLLGRGVDSFKSLLVVLTMVVITVLTANLTIAFLSGVGIFYIYREAENRYMNGG